MEYKGFNREGFLEYLNETFYGLDNPMFRNTIRNIIEYANEHEHISKDMFCKFVSDMIDEVEFGEVAMFMDDKCLTENGKAEKNKFLAHRIEMQEGK